MKSFTVSTAAPAVFHVPRTIAGSITIAAVPGAGGTLLVETQVAPGGVWTEWPDGAVSAATVGKLDAKMHALRFTAATEDGVVELGY